MLDDTPSEAPIRAGRPTREQARARQVALLDAALEHFLDKGYEGATIEAIAADVNMTKRTVYARYADKTALFRAAIRHGTQRRAVGAEVIEATRGGTLEETLVAIATLRIDLVRDADGAKLQRIINTESYRFPDIFQTYYDIAALPTVRFLAEILAEETRAGRLAIDDPILAANVFMSMVVSGPVRFILSGNELGREDIDRRVRFAIRLFLEGAEPR
ncbi:TetR/AcrR family transcriptional regulator [Novosphingobium sp. AP12]|uniref:TetR/AcrR family transcriptional regulator n=1 Tax=Novosphingobium sp. AP12 TaxID=1144305 RepID=UPI000271E725|nr:TetR/AcrR family transcriptional regulator [Novosphingobium sp. AP12]EJL33342.1 transcriptional regulator [Novosphingobium sp. AP12]